jgi:hypothetical protein
MEPRLARERPGVAPAQDGSATQGDPLWYDLTMSLRSRAKQRRLATACNHGYQFPWWDQGRLSERRGNVLRLEFTARASSRKKKRTPRKPRDRTQSCLDDPSAGAFSADHTTLPPRGSPHA